MEDERNNGNDNADNVNVNGENHCISNSVTVIRSTNAAMSNITDDYSSRVATTTMRDTEAYDDSWLKAHTSPLMPTCLHIRKRFPTEARGHGSLGCC